MPQRFLTATVPPLTVMVSAKTADRAVELITKAKAAGAEAIGLQRCHLLPEERTEQNDRRLLEAVGDFPLYVTNYRYGENEKKADEQLAEELLRFAAYRPILADVMGDIFDRSDEELTENEAVVEKQRAYIGQLHSVGATVLMSSHIFTYRPADRVLAVAAAHRERGADISKIVTGAATVEQELDNLCTTAKLKTVLPIPFLFLSGGVCELHRRVGPMLGSCMYLCAYEHDELATASQPLLSHCRQMRDSFDFPWGKERREFV